MGCPSFYLIFKNVFFIIYCTEHTKGIIWLRRSYGMVGMAVQYLNGMAQPWMVWQHNASKATECK